MLKPTDAQKRARCARDSDLDDPLYLNLELNEHTLPWSLTIDMLVLYRVLVFWKIHPRQEAT